ncbi:TPA: T9SS type A sorting domain-containing protein, partial [Candidatus Poribacteria bacterium]|nr:T9SS type A sorting domain-containing protein [Candidatus Poribacteria bacterium]
PIILTAETAITGGPQIGGYFVIRADLSVTIDTSGELIGRGDIFLISEDGRLAGAELGISVQKGLWIKGDINILNILMASGQVALDRRNQLQGVFRGILACPEDWWLIGGRKFADVRSYFDNTKIAAAVKVAFFEVGVLYDEDGFHVLMNLKEIKEIVGAAPELAAGEHILMAPSQTAANIPPNTPFALFVLTWTEGDTDIELVSPSGKRLSRNDALAEPDKYFYQKDMGRREITFAVNQPEAGNWQVVIPDVLKIGEYRLKILGGNMTPKLLLGTLIIDEANLKTKITWQDKDDDDDANISLYYDTDAEGFDGALIVENISEDDELDGFQWDFSDVASGTYYIYGKIDDGVNMPVFSYSSTPLIVQNRQAPEPPTELKGMIEGDNIELNWKESPSGEAVEGYVLYWTDKPHQPGYPYRLAIGNQTEYTLEGLELGRTYRIAIVAYDAQARESTYSEPIEVSLQTTAENNPPQITSQPSLEGQVGKIYSCNVDAEDYDKDVLSYSLKVAPKGATIDSATGVITWTPAESQAGNNSFIVLVQDNAGGQDEQAFTVMVSDVNHNPEAFIVSPPMDKPISGEYLIRWQANDKDNDELTVELYYSANGGKTYIQFASGLENTGEYLWDTTTVTDGTYKLAITVRDAQSSTTDYTEGVFTIKNKLRPWDVNNDGVVDISDLVLVGIHFGESGEGVVGDVNEDGAVDISDLVLVGIHFGEQAELRIAKLGASSPIPGLSITPVLKGDILQVDVHAEGLADLYGFQFAMTYQKDMLSLLSVTEGNLLKQGGDTYWKATNTQAGRCEIASTRLRPQKSISQTGKAALHQSKATGSLATFTFHVHNPHRVARASVVLENIKLAGIRGKITAASTRINYPLEALVIPETSELLANYPNPFNPDTWIPYRLSKPSDDVKIHIYNTTGQLVRTLNLGHQAAGLYESKARAAYWDGRNEEGETIASGIYFYTLRTGTFTATRKMLITK